MSKSLSGKVAVVTGAGRGIGAAIAARLLDDGADVFALDKARAGGAARRRHLSRGRRHRPGERRRRFPGDRQRRPAGSTSSSTMPGIQRVGLIGKISYRRLLGSDRHAPQRVLPVRLRSGAAHGRGAARRRDRQHRLDRRFRRPAGARPLLRGEGRHPRPDPGAGARSRKRRHPRQCGRAWLHPHQIHRTGAEGRVAAGGLDGGPRADEAARCDRRDRRGGALPCRRRKPPT